MADNVQTFINMAYLQKTYSVLECPIAEKEKVHIQPEPGKKLLLLDMDETLLHAATLNDIYDAKIYGPHAKPTFFTSFKDRDSLIEIGIFLRPCLQELIQRVSPYFTLCVFTASERLYADAILDQIDPDRKIFKHRIYRSKCLKAFLPIIDPNSPRNSNPITDFQ